MISGTFTEDGSTGWMQTEDHGGVHISVKGMWGAGSLTIEHRINGTAYVILDPDDVVVTHTDNFNRHVFFEAHDVFRLTLAGSTTPALDYSVAGKSFWAYN